MTMRDTNPGHPPPQNHDKFKWMTQEEFEKWLDKVDLNNDGYINHKELRIALKQLGLKHGAWKAWRAMRAVDRNRNNVIDASTDERKLLIEHAAKHWGIRVVAN
jgi:Ca2+-binding EF-hand superfamily protein